jgi:hypothetical protein
VVRKAGDRDHGGAVELRVVETVEQMHAAGTRGRETAADAAGPFRVRAGHEGGGLLVSHLDESDRRRLLARVLASQRFHDPVDAVAWHAEDRVDTPRQQAVDQYVRPITLRHSFFSWRCGTVC